MSHPYIPITLNLFSKDKNVDRLRPFIRWAGGKQKIINALMAALPPEGTYSNYFEPFLGAGSLFLAKGFKTATLSDLNFHLINTYHQVRDNCDELYDLFMQHARSLQEQGQNYYYAVRKAYNENLEIDDEDQQGHLEQAARFLFLNHSNFNGLFRVNKQGHYNVPYGKPTTLLDPQHLHRISQRLKNNRIVCLSYEELENDIDGNSFVYLDPPYPEIEEKSKPMGPEAGPVRRKVRPSFTSYNIEKFDAAAHLKLAQFAQRISERGAKVMISVAEATHLDPRNPAYSPIREWYPMDKWRYHGLNIERSIHRKGNPQVVRELIITNYKTGLTELAAQLTNNHE